MSWYNRFLIIVCLCVMTGCGNDPLTIEVMPGKTLTVDGEYMMYDVPGSDHGYIWEEDNQTQATITIKIHDRLRTSDEKQRHMQSSSQLSYTITDTSIITNSCDQTYELYEGTFVSDPVQEELLYMSYIFLTINDKTATIAHLTKEKSHHKSRKKSRKKTYGCAPDT